MAPIASCVATLDADVCSFKRMFRLTAKCPTRCAQAVQIWLRIRLNEIFIKIAHPRQVKSPASPNGALDVTAMPSRL